MKFDLISLTTYRHWRSSIGMPKEKFYQLLPHFGTSYKSIYGKTIGEWTFEKPNSPSITKFDNLIFFILFSYKSCLTYDLLGLVSV